MNVLQARRDGYIVEIVIRRDLTDANRRFLQDALYEYLDGIDGISEFNRQVLEIDIKRRLTQWLAIATGETVRPVQPRVRYNNAAGNYTISFNSDNSSVIINASWLED